MIHVNRRRHALRLVPAAVAAGRLVLGAAALVLALDGSELSLTATCITLGVVAGGVNGWISRWLEADDPAVARLNDLVDYLTLVVAPWGLVRAMAVEGRGVLQEVLLDVVLLAGAVRIARQERLAKGEAGDALVQSGLGLECFALVSAISVFLHLPEILAGPRFLEAVLPVVSALCVLMVVPLPYPRLALIPGFSPLILALLAAMPFVQTEIIALAVATLGLLYVIVGSFFLPERIPPGPDARSAGSGLKA